MPLDEETRREIASIVQSDRVVLLRAKSKTEFVVNLERLCREDKIWLSTNRDRIRTNGLKVKRFLLDHSL